MKKIFYFVAMCLFLSTNLYMSCEDIDVLDIPHETHFSVDGGVDTLGVICRGPNRDENGNFYWRIVDATDYDWHAGEHKSVEYEPDAANPDSMDCGWFTVKKSLDNDFKCVIIKVEKNVTGKNRHAVIRLHPSAEVDVYQDCK